MFCIVVSIWVCFVSAIGDSSISCPAGCCTSTETSRGNESTCCHDAAIPSQGNRTAHRNDHGWTHNGSNETANVSRTPYLDRRTSNETTTSFYAPRYVRAAFYKAAYQLVELSQQFPLLYLYGMFRCL